MPGNIANITPSTIAQWPTPNYVNPPERTWMPIYAGALYGVSSAMIAVRLWLRILKQAGGLGLDDALLAFAWLGSSMFTAVLVLSSTPYHTGRHAWDIPLQNFEYIALLAWLAQFSSLVTGAATKISVLCFYRRLVVGTYSRRWKVAVLVAIAFTVAWTLTFIFMLIFNCGPTRAYWKSFDPIWAAGHDFKCINTTVVNLLAGIFAAASDFYAVVLPCLITRHFDLPRGQKIALNLIFCLGLLVVGASGIRTYYLWRKHDLFASGSWSSANGNTEVGFNSDVSWMIFDAYIWAQFELQLSIICASLPALRVFLRRYFSQPLSRTGNSRTSLARSRQSYLENVNMQNIVDPRDDPLHPDWDLKHQDPRHGSIGDTTVVGSEVGRSRSPSAPSEARLWKGPLPVEPIDVEEAEDYGWSIRSPSFERVKSSRVRHNFSQPFPKDRSFYNDKR